MEESNLQSGPTDTGSVGFPQSSPSQPKSKTGLIIFIILGILLIAGAVIFFLSKKSASVVESPSPSSFFEETSPTPLETVSPSPVASASPVSKASLKIQVLNGTGIPGEASYLQGILNKLGYTNITAGNADTSTATATQITYGSGVTQSVKDEIETKLKGIYTSVTSSTSSSLTSADINIVTGTRKGASPVASATPKPSISPSASASPTASASASPH